MHRRQLLKATGVGSLALLAGCSDSDGDGGDRQGGDANNNDDGGGGGGEDTASPTETPTADAGSDQMIEVLEHEFYDDGSYETGVKGTLENVSGQELSYVEVKAFFLDGDGTQIGEGLDNTTDLAADRKWKFDCVYLDDNGSEIEEYELKTDVSNY